MDLNKKLAKLREERAAAVEAQRALLEKGEVESRDLSKEEGEQFDTLATRAKDLAKQIAQVEDLIEAERSTARRAMEDGRGKGGKWGENEVRVRYQKDSLAAFRGQEQVAYEAGMWARSVIWGDHRAMQWCHEHGIDTRASGEAVFGQAGVLVPDQMSQAIIDLREQYGLARQLCRIQPMASDTMIAPRRVAGVTAYWVGEATAPTESDKTWGSVNLVAKTLGALSKVSLELTEDAVIDVAADVAQEQAYAFAYAEDNAWLNGDGTSTYGGIRGIRTKIIDGNYTAGAVDGASGHDTFAEMDHDDLLSVIGALPQYAAANARWIISKRGKALIFDALAAAAGGNTIMSIGERPRPTYLGDPIEISQLMPTTTGDQSDTVMALYGDFRLGSIIGDRRGFSVQVLRELYATTRQIGINAFERVDIVTHGLGDTTTAGPIVALVGE